MSRSSRALERCTILIDRKGAAGRSGLAAIVAIQFLGDAGQPCLELHRLAILFARVQRRKTAYDPDAHWAMTSSGPEADEHRRGNNECADWPGWAAAWVLHSDQMAADCIRHAHLPIRSVTSDQKGQGYSR